MLIGIVSDSHDNVPMLERAVEHFNAEGCDFVIHAGDIVAPFAMQAMGALKAPFAAVFGNNDGEKVGLKMKAAAAGGSIEEPPLLLDKGGLRILVLHDCDDWRAASREHSADVVIFGHTHEIVVESAEGKSQPMGINPGESGGWLSGRCSIALLDTDSLEVKLLDLKLEPGKGIRQ